MKIATPSEKSSPLSQQPPLKIKVKPTLLKTWLEAQPPPPAEKGEGGHANYEMGHLPTKVTHNIDSTDEPVVQHVPVATKYICR